MIGLLPFVLTFLGIFSDYVSTQIGLSRGFVEINPNCSFIIPFVIVEAGLLLCHVAIPSDYPHKLHYMVFIACLTFFGAVHNVLVLAGVFNGFT